jgi:hypothetical protein
MMGALLQDEAAGVQCTNLNQAAFDHLQQGIAEAMREERAAGHRHYTEAWRDWINTAQAKNKGWLHRWSGLRETWKPTQASADFTGKPIDALNHEKDRLSTIWQCESEPHALFEPPPDAWLELPEITAEDFIRAARSFPARTAQTWDGFHPRHFAMVTEDQAKAIIGVLRLMERIGATPSAIRAV